MDYFNIIMDNIMKYPSCSILIFAIFIFLLIRKISLTISKSKIVLEITFRK